MRYTSGKHNFLGLVSIQGLNALLPLVLFPFALMTLGSGAFAKVVIAESISFIFLALVLYGFEIISIEVAQKEGVNKAFNDVFFSRLLILLGLVLFSAPTLLVLELEVYFCLLAWLLVPLGQILHNSVIYIFLKVNFYQALFVVIGRFTTLLLVFIYLKPDSELYLFPLFVGLGWLISGSMSLLFLLFYMDIKLNIPTISEVKQSLIKGFSVFLSNCLVLLYRDVNVILLGLASVSPHFISTYAIAEKYIKGLQASIRPINQLFLPKIVTCIGKYQTLNKKLFRELVNVSRVQLICIFTLVLLSFLLSFFLSNSTKPEILSLITISNETALLFSIMLPSIILGVCNFIFGSVTYNIMGKGGVFVVMTLAVGVFNLIFCYGMALSLGVYAGAIAFLVSELFLFFLVTIYFFRYASGEQRGR